MERVPAYPEWSNNVVTLDASVRLRKRAT
jgi:hypothetical protein